MKQRKQIRLSKDAGRSPPAARKTHKVVYLYRDASNYKFWGEFYVLGNLSLDDLRPYLFDSEYFVPEQIGLLSLVPDKQNLDDHVFHEFADILPAESAPYLYTSEEIIALVRKADQRGWLTGLF